MPTAGHGQQSCIFFFATRNILLMTKIIRIIRLRTFQNFMGEDQDEETKLIPCVTAHRLSRAGIPGR
jgi:hypothetical protein